jgi:hypothetical protein
MDVNDITNVPKLSRSISGIRMFKVSKSNSSGERNSISRDLGCYSTEGHISTSLRPEEEDSILIQLESGLFGITHESVKGNGSVRSTGNGVVGNSYYPFQRQNKKLVDRSMSNQSIDPDHFLWSNDNDENAALSMK